MPTLGANGLRAETVLTRAAVLFRLGALAQLALALPAVAGQLPDLGVALVLALVVTGESLALSTYWWRKRRVDRRTLTADVLFCSVALYAEAWLPTSSGLHTWAFFMYPFTLLAAIAIGIGYRRLGQVLAAAAVLMVAYWSARLTVQGESFGNFIPDSLSYGINAVVTFLVSSGVRRSGAVADAAEEQAMARAAEAAAQRQAAEYARVLHDRALQTLEMLSRDATLTDPELRAHVRDEAVWLRALVEGGRPGPTDSLLGVLHEVVREQTRRGLRIDLNVVALRAGPPGADPGPGAAAAIGGAVREALTNVAKHAGVRSAVVRAARDPGGRHLVVSVVDNGDGFDPGAVEEGLGLRCSIRERIAAVGGHVCVTSQPGAGTDVELWIPIRDEPA
ncbi:sensor histidine kinase [Micromonospora sp. NPDC000212]|uniref:sensor histidine kinase n=1 Tax=Micromonospora sp. NPDC000212 TaxID=3364215 RepID=UPI003698197D